MNNSSNSMFSLGKKNYVKSYENVTINKNCIDSSAYISKKQKIAIGKPYYVSKNFSSQYSNVNDVIHAKKKARSGGTVAPPKSNIYPR